MRLADVKIEGNQQLPAAAITDWAGLRAGATVTDRQLHNVCQKLVDTGLFTAANYSYLPAGTASGYTYIVKLTVAEDTSTVPVQVDVEGINSETIWRELQRSSPFVQHSMPDNDAAQSFYQKQIEAALVRLGHPGMILARREADLRTQRMQVVFQSTSAIKIASVSFEGSRSIDQDELKRKMQNAVVGQPYSERDVREALRANATPMYEALGYLRVAYPKMTRTTTAPNQAAVVVTVDEGRVWRAGALEFTGDALPNDDMQKAAEFPAGQVANWPLMVASVTRAERILRSRGYIQVSAELVRKFHDDTGVVDLQVGMVRGPQFVFGDLRFEGLSADETDVVGRRFGLRSGAPLDEPYIDTYTAQIQRILGAKARNMERRFVTRADQRTVDVVFKIG